jgi:hypothetical protein
VFLERREDILKSLVRQKGAPGIVLRAGTTTLFGTSVLGITQASGIDSLESIAGLLKRLQIRAQRFTSRSWAEYTTV